MGTPIYDKLDQLQIRTTPCKGNSEQFLNARPNTPQATANEKLCRQCPQLDRCQDYADALEQWEKQGTIAGVTYRQLKEPSSCFECGGWFHTKKADRKYCSQTCSAVAQAGNNV